MNKKLVIGIVAGVLVLGGAGGGALWYMKSSGAPAAPKAEPKKPHKYLTLDKVIVMLRRAPGETETHYLSADLVVTTTEDKEKLTKEHLPLLRSIAVKALSSYQMEAASTMTVDELAKKINTAFDESYEEEKMDKPFSEVMIGKLIIE